MPLETLRNMYNGAVQRGGELLDRGRELGNDALERGGEAVEAAKDAYAEAEREAKSRARHFMNDADHAKDDLLLKVNPNTTVWDRAGNAIDHGIDNVKVAAQDAYDWAGVHPYQAAGIAAGVPIALAGSYYLYKKMKDRQNGGRR